MYSARHSNTLVNRAAHNPENQKNRFGNTVGYVCRGTWHAVLKPLESVGESTNSHMFLQNR